MSLEILENDNVYHVNGTLTSKNIHILNKYISKVINTSKCVILNLEGVIQFDSKAAYILLKIFIDAVHNNTKFSVIGKRNKKLIQVLQETETMHIWSQSRILR